MEQLERAEMDREYAEVERTMLRAAPRLPPSEGPCCRATEQCSTRLWGLAGRNPHSDLHRSFDVYVGCAIRLPI